MNITREQYAAAYRIGLLMHDKPEELGIAEAKRRLAPTGLNSNSAADFIYNVGHLLRGECYKRAMSESATDNYLTWIRRDRGDQGLSNALIAVKKNIDFRQEKNPKAPCKGQILVLKKHRALLNAINESSLVLEWRDAESAGMMDWFPLSWFAEEGETKKLCHPVGANGRPQGNAWCDVSVQESTAELDYQPYRKLNEDNQVFLGVVRLSFENEDRTAITHVEWKSLNEPAFTQADARPLPPVVPPAGEAYQPPLGATDKVTRKVRERRGQAKFRRNLQLIYSYRCCISGCSVLAVLEGAHIDPFQNEQSDHIQNGLLLRADLHTLFDRHLISIDPETMRIHVAKSAQAAADYAPLHGKTLLVPEDAAHHPDQGALRRHWQKWRNK